MTLPTTQQLDIASLLDDMAETLGALRLDSPLVVGIQTGGMWVAEHLQQALGLTDPLGALDISFYRDDFSRIGLNPEVRGSHLPISIDGRSIVLVDDVLHSGRTVRAALNELFAWGRPASVTLAVLIDRGNRELPFQADVAGHRINLDDDQFVKVSADGAMILEQKAST